MIVDAKPRARFRQWLVHRHLLYSDEYVFLFFVSLADVALTWLLLRWTGQPVNHPIDFLLANLGFTGLALWQLLVIVLVMVACEEIGRRRQMTGRRVAETAILVACIPVVAAIVQMAFGF